MSFNKSKLFFAIFVLFFTVSVNGFGQSKNVSRQQKSDLHLKRVNPDGWFNLLVPEKAGKPETHASVDGGTFTTDNLLIDYIYWKYENTPNPFRDLKGSYSKAPMLACSTKSQTTTRRVVVDGKKAIIQTCLQYDEQKKPEFIYYVTFPKLKVGDYEGEPSGNGMFNLTITYKNRRYLKTVEKIVRSLNFNI